MSEREDAERTRSAESRNRGPSSANSTNSASRLLERGRKVERDAQSFVEDIEGLVTDVEGLVRTSLEARPYATLAIAAGAGFVVGGGLTVGVLGTLVRVGARMATAAVVQGALTRVLAGIQDGEPSRAERSQR
jgi:ElaB/YqjD/DUF883 family membrane-anchored ribosome-binding protein